VHSLDECIHWRNGMAEDEKYEKIVVDIAVAHDRLAQVHNELKDVKRIIKRLNVIKSHVEASEHQRARMLVLRAFETSGNGKMSFADAVQAALSKAGPRDTAAIVAVYPDLAPKLATPQQAPNASNAANPTQPMNVPTAASFPGALPTTRKPVE
jgi:hypothetical protein